LIIVNNQLARYEEKDIKANTSETTNLEIKLFDKLEKFIKESEWKNENIVQMISKTTSLYGAFGEEKIKILEKSFDNFVENIMTGANLKLAFYAVDKPLPTKYKDFERYVKLKKYQRYEAYPDEKTTEYLNAWISSTTEKDEFLNFQKNKHPLILKIKKRLKGGISKLFDAREEIYKALMQIDLLVNLAPGFCFGKEQLLQKLEEFKYSNFLLSYKEALDIDEKEVVFEEKIKLPNPKVFKNLLVKHKIQKEEDEATKEYSKIYKYRKLFFTE